MNAEKQLRSYIKKKILFWPVGPNIIEGSVILSLAGFVPHGCNKILNPTKNTRHVWCTSRGSI